MVAQIDRDFLTYGYRRVPTRLISYLAFEGRPLTTRGQFVNPIILKHLRAAATSRATAPVRRPVFVVGMGRSGTTLLGRILAVHHDVGYLNEPKALWNVIYPFEDIIGTYAADAPGKLRLGAEEATSEVALRAHAVYAYYLRVTRSRRIVDKYPELVFRVPFVRTLFPDALFVTIIRNPTSVVKSVAQWSGDNVDRRTGAGWWGLHDRKWKTILADLARHESPFRNLFASITSDELSELDRACIEWSATTLESLSTARSLPAGNTVCLRYEDLCSDPRPVVTSLLDALRLSRDDNVGEFASRVVRPIDASASANGSGLQRMLDDAHPSVARLLEAATHEAGYA